jgi:hypothetical protein
VTVFLLAILNTHIETTIIIIYGCVCLPPLMSVCSCSVALT